MSEGLHSSAGDQAAGLRRLFGARATQVVAFVSGRESCGRTGLLVQTAAALANAGHGVVVIDEGRGSESALASFGVSPRHDLMDVVQGRRQANQVMHAAAPRIQAVAAARFADELVHLDSFAAEGLNAGLRQIQRDAAFVLVDCAARRGGQVSPLALAARHVAVVVMAQGAAITHAYALIKRLVHEQRRDGFQVVVTRARSDAEAQAIFDNLRTTAREHLGVRLDYLGCCRVPVTDHLADALQSRLPMGAGGEDDGGFRLFETRPEPRRSVPGRAARRLESVV